MTSWMKRFVYRMGALLLLGAWLGSGCANPNGEPIAAEPEVAADETQLGSEGEASDAREERESDEPSAPGATAPEPDPRFRDYDGPRLSISASPGTVAPGDEVTLSARMRDAQGSPIEITETMSFTWRVPEGWTIEGEGASVTLTAPATLEGSDHDIGLRIEEGGRAIVRGGVLLRGGPST